MTDYNFWQDILDTYQSFSDWLKFAWLVIPFASTVAFVALILQYRLARHKADYPIPATPLYTIGLDETGEWVVYYRPQRTIAYDKKDPPPAPSIAE